MRVFVACILIIGLAVLLIIGLLRLVRDLLARDPFEAPSSPNEEHAVQASLKAAGERHR